MSPRRDALETGQIYHIFSKSIAGFKIFRYDAEFVRIKSLLSYYKKERPSIKFSAFIELKNQKNFLQNNDSQRNDLIKIIAYCFMPTHIHIILKQLNDSGISHFMNNVLNSYTRYFNIKTKRKGPLWETRFKNVLVSTNEQLLHLTRYLHLNPVTANLVDKPQQWRYSSYQEFLGKIEEDEKICRYMDLLDIKYREYQKFVESQIDYQKELGINKALFIE